MAVETPPGTYKPSDFITKSASRVRRDKAAFSSGCKSHPAKSLQPEATGAVMEVAKWLKPSDSGSRIGDRASVQAATRVNAEQASKRTMCRPTRRLFRGRLIWLVG
jgi:hypothetical protein